MAPTVIGILHPGEMGSAVGAAARGAGARVVWASEGRSAATRGRAEADGLEDVSTLPHLVAASGVILSVCPPGAAAAVAREIAGLGFRGLYIDANAVAPETSRTIAQVVTAAGASFVDGGIIGPPPRRPGTTRLYLSGAGASDAAALFAKAVLEAITIDGPVGAASALKMAYAAWNKGSQALVMAVRALAAREGVGEALLAEWARSMPEVRQRSEHAVSANTRKAWRFVGEMDEIAITFAAAGLPDGFPRAAADLYRRLARWKDVPVPPSFADVMKVLAP